MWITPRYVAEEKYSHSKENEVFFNFSK
jgi:WASH complex subunit CCDC53